MFLSCEAPSLTPYRTRALLLTREALPASDWPLSKPGRPISVDWPWIDLSGASSEMICEVKRYELPREIFHPLGSRPFTARQPHPKLIWPSAKQMIRLAILAAIAGVCLFGHSGRHVLAKTGQAADAKDAASAVDPDAVDAVRKMGAYLRSLKVFQVQGDVTHDDVLEDGLIIQSNSKIDMLAVKPNRMRAEVTSDDKHRLYFYDGKTFTAWGKLTNYYATVPAPPTIPELFQQVQEKYRHRTAPHRPLQMGNQRGRHQ